MSKIIAVANQKGGVAKTTTTLNLGVALTLKGKRVCLIDFDPQANLSAYLGYDDSIGTPNINEMMSAMARCGENAKDGERCIVHNEKNNIDYVPSDINLSSAEFYLAQSIARESVLKRVLSAPYFAEYDYIFIDCLPSLGILNMNALTAADGVIIPVQPQRFAMDGLGWLTDIIGQIKNTVNPKLDITGVLLTMVDNTTVSRTTETALREKYGNKVFDNKISRSVDAANSAATGKSLCLETNAKHTKLGEEYKRFATEFLSRCE